MKIQAVCHTCRHQHGIDFDPRTGPGGAFGDWLSKHPHHDIDFLWPGRTGKAVQEPEGYLHYLHNADVKTSYVASSDLTITLASLATSSTKLGGQESTLVDNSSNKYLDYLLAGKVSVGTTPTTATGIDVCLVGISNDSTWPDVFDGTDSAETVTNQEVKDQVCKPFAVLSVVSTTSNVAYWFGPGSVASRFGGTVPLKWSAFVTHNTAVNLNSTGGNHALSITPVYLTVV